MKNILTYLLLMFVSFVHHILTAIFYPLVFLFRHKILRYAEKRITENPETKLFEIIISYTNNVAVINNGLYVKRFSKWKIYINPLFWGFLFTTGLTSRYAGPEWFKKELKKKWFIYDWAIYTFKERLQYFWLCYCWGGLRNAGWAFQQWFLTEGAAKRGTIQIIIDSIYIIKGEKEYGSLLNMPQAKFKDADGADRNNSGPYIKYDGEGATQEGIKIITFETHKGKRRFKYAFCKIHKLDMIKKFLVVELVFGWDTFDGMAYWHSKFMFKKMDELALEDYNKYKT